MTERPPQHIIDKALERERALHQQREDARVAGWRRFNEIVTSLRQIGGPEQLLAEALELLSWLK